MNLLKDSSIRTAVAPLIDIPVRGGTDREGPESFWQTAPVGEAAGETNELISAEDFRLRWWYGEEFIG